MLDNRVTSLMQSESEQDTEFHTIGRTACHLSLLNAIL